MGLDIQSERKPGGDVRGTILVSLLVLPLPVLSLLLFVLTSQYSGYMARHEVSVYLLVYVSPVILLLAALWLVGAVVATRRWKARDNAASLMLAAGSAIAALLMLMAVFGG